MNMKRIAIFVVLFIVSMNMKAQWTTNTAVNTEVNSFVSSNVDFQSIRLSDGRTVVVYWKEVPSPIYYELRMQVMSTSGVKQLGTDGVLISDSIPMSTYINTWTLIKDDSDYIYIGLNGTTSAKPGFVFKVNSLGVHVWPSSGVSLGEAFSIKVLPLSNGNTAVTWLSNTTYTSYVQVFNNAGNSVWTNNVLIAATGVTVPANLFELSNGDVVSIYHLRVGYGINSTIYAQRFDSLGNYVWSSPTQLSNKTTAFNYDYSPAQDGDTIYFGYVGKTSTRFDSYIQRLNPDGSKPWGANGLDFDVNATNNMEMDTRIAIEEGSPYLWAVCTYTNSNQSQFGEYVQKIYMNTGTRLFTNNAKQLFPIGSFKVHDDELYVSQDRPYFILKKGMDNGISETFLDLVFLDQDGNFELSDTSKAMASNTGSNKGAAILTEKIEGQLVVVFEEGKINNDSAKIYAQNYIDTVMKSSDADFLNYVLPAQDSSFIISSNDSIIVYMPAGTTYPISLAAGFVISDSANAFIGGTVQDSAIDINIWNDSITPVVYNVVSQNALTSKVWKVYVKVAKTSTIGFDDAKNTEGAKVYFENPVHNSLTIVSSSKINDISIYDAMGRLVFEQSNVYDNNLRVNTSDWNSGMYVFVINSKKSYKFIKK